MLTTTSACGVDEVTTFKVKYAGLVQDIRGDIDPSGRTGLLKILDQAKLNGQIKAFSRTRDFAADAVLRVDTCSISVNALENGELLLCVPIHSIASVGFVREECENILPIKIGDISSTNRDLFDLAVVYCGTADIAEKICNILGQCFSQIYKEAASNYELKSTPLKSLTGSSVSPTNNSRPLFMTDSHPDLRAGIHPPDSTSASRSESADDRTDELIKDYMSVLTACLSTQELAEYAALIVRWRDGSMPIIELAQKLSELYGTERIHLLTRMRCLLRNRSREDIDAFDSFVEMLNLSDVASGSS
uniref:Malcavernin n=1 Tax=Ascaris suum TaxID=6253 RepID=F1L3N6_ASCSU